MIGYFFGTERLADDDRIVVWVERYEQTEVAKTTVIKK